MPIESVTDFVEELRESGLLDASWLEEVSRDLGPHSEGVASLAQDLVRRGWLTSFQVRRLLEGRGRDLMVGPYRLLDRLGKGGMGEVFKSLHCRLGRLTALKIIRKERLANANTVQRFLREARVAAQLSHANVVLVYDGNQVGDLHYLAMEYVEGVNLAHLVKESGPLPATTACDYVRQAALGLQHAHEHGLVHRDIKPSNLILTRAPSPLPLSPEAGERGRGEGGAHGSQSEGVVKVLDFGLARFTSEEVDPTPLTGDGQMMGTMGFVAPEQAENARAADIRADIFSLGATLFFLLTGSSPRAGVAPGEELQARLPGDCRALAAVLAKMTAFHPADRYQTPAEVVAALAPFCRQVGTVLPRTPVLSECNGAEASLETTPQPQPREVSSPPGRTPVGTDTPPAAAPEIRTRMLPVLAAGCCLAAVVGLVVLLIWKNREPVGQPTPPITTPAEAELIAPPRPVPQEEKEFVNSIGIKLARIPPGAFLMGSPDTEVGHTLLEAPRHEVWITRPFLMGAHEVTQGQYLKVMLANPSRFSAKGAGHAEVGDEDTSRFPVEMVTWEDAQTFCRLLSERPEEKQAGRHYRLPTEAEWEYACRAGTTGPFHFGNTLSSDRANVNGQVPYGGAAAGVNLRRPAAVGSYSPNRFGLYDMHGNVWEWCADLSGPYSRDLQLDPTGPTKGDGRVCRGGAFTFAPASCRSAVRYFAAPLIPDERIGFRVVCEVQRPGGPSR